MRNFNVAISVMAKGDATKHPKPLKQITMAIVSCSLLSVAACQKPDDEQQQSHVTEITPAQTKTNTTSSDTHDSSYTGDKNSDINEKTGSSLSSEQTTKADTEVVSPTATTLEKEDIDADNEMAKDDSAITAGTAALKEGESEAFLEKQITDVEYRSANGQSIKVTFQTSALEALEADVMLPSGKRMVLTASPNQGNNPTYRSKDGSIELVTHGGGGSIDLMSNGKSVSFDAVSADAEVVSPT